MALSPFARFQTHVATVFGARPKDIPHLCKVALKRKAFMKKCEIIMRRAMISLLMCVSVSLSPVYGQQAVVPSPFLSAAVFDGQRAALVLAPQNVNEAVQIIRRIIDLSPDTASSHYLLASLLARQKKMDAAFDRLTIAVRKGFRDLKLLNSDPSLLC